MIASSYDTEIDYNTVMGDIEIYDMGDEISYDLKCLRKDLCKGYISKLEYEISANMIGEFLYEYIAIRENEYDKWFKI